MSRSSQIETLISEVGKRKILWDMRDKNYHNRNAVDEEWSKVAQVVQMSSNEAKAKWKSLRDSFRRELKKMPQEREGEETWRSRWVYFDSMIFLRDVMKFKDSHQHKASRRRRRQLRPTSDSDESNFSISSNKKHLNGGGRLTDVPEEEEEEDLSLQTPAKRSRPRRCVTKQIEAAKLKREHGIERNASEQKKKRKIEQVQDEEQDKEVKEVEEEEDDDDLSFFKSLLPYIRKLPPLRKLQVRSRYQSILIEEIQDMESKDKMTVGAFSNFIYPSSPSLSSSSTSPSSSSSSSSSTSSETCKPVVEDPLGGISPSAHLHQSVPQIKVELFDEPINHNSSND